ncbi:MAG: hypothetical protein NC483_03895 [Ruminococcus sp.]|nr:hypothetical protein [Ruminococcus sp.]
MQVNLVFCLFVLDSEKNVNFRKNDLKKIKVLVKSDTSLPEVIFNGGDMKETLRKKITNIIGKSIFHMEQVYTMSYEDSIDIIYLGATNIQDVTLIDDYKLIDFSIKNNELIFLDNRPYKYKTKEIEANNNIEYIHEIDVDSKSMGRNILNILVSYKKLKSNIDNTDILFKFFGDSFTLEDLRILYELIKDTRVDKSNFRKRIVKYCEKIEEKSSDKNGYRPSQKYKFKPLKGDIWI